MTVMMVMMSVRWRFVLVERKKRGIPARVFFFYWIFSKRSKMKSLLCQWDEWMKKKGSDTSQYWQKEKESIFDIKEKSRTWTTLFSPRWLGLPCLPFAGIRKFMQPLCVVSVNCPLFTTEEKPGSRQKPTHTDTHIHTLSFLFDFYVRFVHSALG